MSENPALTIVIPCYNEADNIPVVLPQILAHCRDKNYRLIVVNDGSKDDSAALLAPYNGEFCRILSHKVNRGYGGALKTGLDAVETPWAITIDSDGQHKLEDVDRLFDAARTQDADLVVGARPQGTSGAYRSFGKWIIRKFASTFLSLPVQDMNSGMKLYLMAEARPYWRLCPNSMAFSDIVLLLMVNDRKKVIEVPIEIEDRKGGQSTIGAHTAVQTMVEIVNISMLLCPLKICMWLSGAFFLLGLLWGARTYYWGSGNITPTSTFLILCAFLFFIIGFLAEQLALLRRETAGIK